MPNLKDMYNKNINIMEFFRENSDNGDVNSINAILTSYDLQSGSYTRNYEINKITDNFHINGKKVSTNAQEIKDKLGEYLASLINEYDYKSILEAGVGEATSMVSVVKKLENQDAKLFGFDISASRIKYAKLFAEKHYNKQIRLFVANLLNTPFKDNEFDIVYTVHAIEPNTNNCEQIVRELYRITNKYLILYEPSYELGNEETKANIEKHKYIKNLKSIVENLNYKIIKYELAPIGTYSNQPAIMIIEKARDGACNNDINFACPICKSKLDKVEDGHYCNNCYRLFPRIKDIDLLREENSVIFSKYLE